MTDPNGHDTVANMKVTDIETVNSCQTINVMTPRKETGQSDTVLSVPSTPPHSSQRPSTVSMNSTPSKGKMKMLRKVSNGAPEQLGSDDLLADMDLDARASAILDTKLRVVERKEEQLEDQRERFGSGVAGPVEEIGDVVIRKMTGPDWVKTGIIACLSIALVGILMAWSENGLMPEDHIGRSHYLKTRVGHIHAPIFATPVNISLHGAGKEVFDVRMVVGATADFGAPLTQRRLFSPFKEQRRLASKKTGDPSLSKQITYRLLADDAEFFKKTITVHSHEELEHFETVDVGDLGANAAEHYKIEVTSDDGSPTAFMCQVVRMDGGGRLRFAIGLVIFLITFASIVAEKIHRSYSAFIGASVTICVVTAIQEPVHLHTISGMISWDTLMLLFSMMIIMQMLAMTGFFGWFAVKVIEWSKAKPWVIFLLLTNICGFMSMILDNVTCVLLMGPLTYQVAQKLNLYPRPIFLSMTICATVGGTATLIGDPPNIVIGTKLKISFVTFLVVNAPIVSFVLLPVASLILYYRFKDNLCKYGDGLPPPLDLVQLKVENRITNEPMFAQFCCTFLSVLLGLMLSPFHDVEPAWFCVMCMAACGLLFDRHHFGKWLELVEWDTLFFFALLFVLVEALSELGVIRDLGGLIIDLIEAFPVDTRMYFALCIILWVSGIGSAFLESLPYTTTMVYIISDLMRTPIDGVNVDVLVWPLSIGACVGGIGSIMGSSANLVCMAVSTRYAEDKADVVQGGDFLRYGLPTLIVLLLISTVWLLFLFVWVGLEV
eukprot:TRINITY_DN22925_c0_g1_i2.p1 TRINITY_DN22925_c0_g1~~TRINITY_DN22925_c0_g1_i2.p1  ORF type:complete len:776 (-),score=166.16 TRINITY_DN22925_c0_g1_i2:408-2735(-)